MWRLAGEEGQRPAIDPPAHAASFKGQHEKVALLICFGPHVNATNNAGLTALHMACIRGAGHPRCVKVLLAAGCRVDARSDRSMTPLACACMWKHAECAKILILAGATLQAPLSCGEGGRAPCATLLEWAAKSQKRQDAIADRLVQRGKFASRQICLQSHQTGTWYNGAAQLVLDGAMQWNPQTHRLFPAAARTRAVQLLMLSYHMERADHMPIPLAIWVQCIIPHMVGPRVSVLFL